MCRRCERPFYPDSVTPFREALPAAFFERDPLAVAMDLVRQGVLLVRVLGGVLMAGRIVEAEAYLAEGDAACHAAAGLRPRHAAMYGRPGTAYVYTLHQATCVNVVTEPPGRPSAVLIRAVAPVEGEGAMRARRPVARAADLTSGPGKVCQALDIGRAAFDGWDLTRGDDLWLARPPAAARAAGGNGDLLYTPEAPPAEPEVPTVRTPRIGVTSARDLLLRVIDLGSPFLSVRPGRRRGPDAEPAHEIPEPEAGILGSP